MTPYFVNLPLGYMFQGLYVDLFLEQGVCPEVGLEQVDLRDPAACERAGELAGRFRRAGLRCTVHLPWTGMSLFKPGGSLESCLDTARLALDVARLFEPVRLVGHPDLPACPLEDLNGEVARCAELWGRVADLKDDGPVLALENTFEIDHRVLPALLAAVDREDVGACFDVGHWSSFARGAVRRDLVRWVEAVSPWLLHVHLHDNHGRDDDHLGLGAGGVDWDEYARALECVPGDVTAALEPHSEEAYLQSLRWLEMRPEFMRRFHSPEGAGSTRDTD